MQTLILYGYERDKYKSYFDQIFRLRYKVFIQQRGWSLPSKDGFEVDQYDTKDAVYFITLNSDGVIEGSVRLTPTVHSSLLADYFPHLVEYGDAPRGDDIYETTRFIVQPVQRTRAAIKQGKSRLLAPVIEWCLDHRLSYFQSVIDAGALSSYVEITPRSRILGLAHPFGGGRDAPGGGECMALRWPVSKDVFDDIVAYGFPEKSPAALSHDPALLNALN